jgi:threonine synthase
MGEFSRSRRLELPAAILKDLRERYSAFASDDAETAATISAVHKNTGRIIDPHTAVGVAAAGKLGRQASPPTSPIVILSTAHPAKFPDAVTQAIGSPPPEPARLAALKDLPERLEILGPEPALIKRFISSRLIS